MPKADAGPDLLLANGLVLYYPCDQANGTTLPDESGNGYDGTLVATSSGTPGYGFTGGKIGSSLRLYEAGSGYVSVPVDVFKDAGDITIATWLRVRSFTAFQRIFDLGIDAKLAQNAETGTVYMTFLLDDPFSNGEHSCSSTKDGYGSAQKIAAPANAISTNTWKHVAVTLSGGNATLYIDAASIGTRSSMLAPKDLGAIDYAFIGRSQFTDDPYLDAQIDEFRVYNRALSASEIRTLYQATGP